MLNQTAERGQGLTEYAVILLLVAIVTIAVLTMLGPIVGNMLSEIIDAFPP